MCADIYSSNARTYNSWPVIWKTNMKSDQIKIILWNDTVAQSCRWSEYAEELIGDWSILWEDSESDYSGAARVLAYKQGQLRYLEWYYGSCSGCDSYEEMSEKDIRKEFETNVMMVFKDMDIFCNWMKMLSGTDKSKFNSLYEAISSAFKNTSINWIEDPARLQDKINVLSLLKE